MEKGLYQDISFRDKEISEKQENVFNRIIAANFTANSVSSPPSTSEDSSRGLPHRQGPRRGFFLFPELLACLLKPQPGYVWVVFLVLWRKSMMKRSLTVSLTSTGLMHFGVTRMQKARALAALTRTGLLSVTRQGRKNPLVTLEVETPPWKHS
jgi:hypothetical protein